jgi:hypothetical protein
MLHIKLNWWCTLIKSCRMVQLQTVVYQYHCNTIPTHQSMQILLVSAPGFWIVIVQLQELSLILIEAQCSTFLFAQKLSDQFRV